MASFSSSPFEMRGRTYLMHYLSLWWNTGPRLIFSPGITLYYLLRHHLLWLPFLTLALGFSIQWIGSTLKVRLGTSCLAR